MSQKSKKVAVITRTKDRLILLYRALNSVSRQTFRDFVWVIVNDGGSKDEVTPVIEEAEKRKLDLIVIHHDTSKGMEAASNAGIAACDSEFIVIHDDDDSWESDFLAKTVDFLENEPLFGGVVTHTLRVDEVIRDNMPFPTACYGLNTGMNSVYLMEMLMVNIFPPISFLYRRSVYNDVGKYDESLPVLGDWDFNIRFLEKYDIGVIPELLALYHHRENITNPKDVLGNTVHAGISKHIRYDALLRNRYLRDQMSGKSSSQTGLLMNLALMTNWQNHRIDSISGSYFIKAGNKIIGYMLQKFAWVRKLKQKIKGLGNKQK